MNPDRIASSKCPATIFAARRRPKDTALDRYEINSINTNKGNNPNGHPAGTKREKNLAPWFWKPKIVAPRTILKLKKKARTKCEVDAKLYGLHFKHACLKDGLCLSHSLWITFHV